MRFAVWFLSLISSCLSLKVAIIGGGIGGSSLAYYLRDLFADADIHLFEKGKVGGRLQTINIGGEKFDAGATILHPANQLALNLTAKFGLKQYTRLDSTVGLYDNGAIKFETSDNDYLNYVRLFWRYSFDVIWVNRMINRLISDFTRIYPILEDGSSFTSADKIIRRMHPDLLLTTQNYFAQFLLERGYSVRFVNELARAALRANYGQDVTVQGFVGLLSMAGMQDGLWSIEGGNIQLVEKLMEASRSKFVAAEVVRVTAGTGDDGKRYNLEVKTPQGSSNHTFDVVVLAFPLVMGRDQISIDNVPKLDLRRFKEKYQRVVATFVQGLPNFTFFQMGSLAEMPHSLINVDSNKQVFFNAMSKVSHRAKHSPEDVWKVFSKEPLSSDQLDALFSTRKETKVHDWLAFPKYRSQVTDWLPFRLDNQALYYLNSCEYVASAMEMQLLCAKNLAQLIYNHATQRSTYIDPAVSGGQSGDKSEL